MASPPIDLRARGGAGDTAFRWTAVAAAGAVLVILAAIAIVMTRRALPALTNGDMQFLTSARWAPASGVYGSLGFLWGTLFTAAIAVGIAVPISLGVALFITQIAPARVRRPLVYLVDLLAVIPSVVFGLWGIFVLGPHFGKSFLTAGIVLAIMITPIITSLAREVIETTPVGEKEAAYALGATRWEMIAGAVWPHSKGGLVGAVMLGLGRAMGETIAAALVIGGSAQVTWHAMAPGYSMPSVIANEWGEADETKKSALIALALLLFVITIAVNLIATAIVRRSQARSRGRGG
jgi:phosphate transport system permease protein